MPKYRLWLNDNAEHDIHTNAAGIRGVEHNEFFARDDISLHEQGVITGSHIVQVEGEWRDEETAHGDVLSSLDGWTLIDIEEI